jgi:hypothetical protein
MAVMLGALYKALLDPNEENARKAAEEVAAYESALSAIRSELAVIKWMVATLIVLVLLVLGRVWMQ